jgi:hypothetical protein
VSSSGPAEAIPSDRSSSHGCAAVTSRAAVLTVMLRLGGANPLLISDMYPRHFGASFALRGEVSD